MSERKLRGHFSPVRNGDWSLKEEPRDGRSICLNLVALVTVSAAHSAVADEKFNEKFSVSCMAVLRYLKCYLKCHGYKMASTWSLRRKSPVITPSLFWCTTFSIVSDSFLTEMLLGMRNKSLLRILNPGIRGTIGTIDICPSRKMSFIRRSCKVFGGYSRNLLLQACSNIPDAISSRIGI